MTEINKIIVNEMKSDIDDSIIMGIDDVGDQIDILSSDSDGELIDAVMDDKEEQ